MLQPFRYPDFPFIGTDRLWEVVKAADGALRSPSPSPELSEDVIDPRNWS